MSKVRQVKKPIKDTMVSDYTFIIYAESPTKIFNGILGTIHMAYISLLLSGGKYLIREKYSGTDPATWYSQTLQEQGIFIQSSRQQTFKGRTYIWLKVDTEKTPVHEFGTWDEITEGDKDTFAWRHVVYPYSPTTGKECLGLACAAQEVLLTEPSQPSITMRDILESVIQEKIAE
jgi:hypothetical protein